MGICFSLLNKVCHVNYYWVKLLVNYLFLIGQCRIVRKFFFYFFLQLKWSRVITYTGISQFIYIMSEIMLKG